MIRLWIAAIFLLQSQIPVQQLQPGAVEGRLLSRNGMPAEGVRIAAVPVSEGQDTTSAGALFGITQTNAEGRYRLENIPAGRYYIFAGLIDLPSYYPNATTLERATALVIKSGATLSGIDFTLARPVTLIVAGHIQIPPTMQVGDGWSVTLTQQTRSAPGNSLQSNVDRSGAFQFPRVSPGEYRLTANLRGSTPVVLKVVDTDLSDVVMPLVDCNAGVTISGRLVGNGVSTIKSISLIGSRIGCTSTAQVETGGSFTFRNVPEGTYQFQLTPAPIGWSGTRVDVARTDLIGVEVPLPALISVKGRANVDDGSDFPRTSRGTAVSIQAVSMNSSGIVNSSIQEDGNFELALPKGRYRISMPALPAGYYLKSMHTGFVDLSAAFFEVGEVTSRDIELTLGRLRRPEPSGVRVAGHLTFPVTGALPNSEGVLLVSASGNRNTAIRESALTPDGSFEFTGVPPGVYNIETFPDNPSALYGIVVNKTDVTGIEFALPVLVKVKGGIEWSDSRGTTTPAAQSSVSVQFTKKEGSKVVAWGALAQSGAFHFYLPEGDYRFSVSELPLNFDLGSVTSGDANILEDGLRIRSDSDPPNLRVTLRGR